MVPFTISYSFTEDGFCMWIYSEQLNRWHVAKPVTLEFTELNIDGETHAPTLKMHPIMGGQFLDAMKKAILSNKDDSVDIAVLKTKIELLEKHIEDLREILKLEKRRMIRVE